MTAESDFPKSLDPIKAELTAYYQELPRLLAEGEAGRFALIKGGTVYDIYDDHEEAYGAGVDRFGPGVAFLVRPIDREDPGRLARYFPRPYSGRTPATTENCLPAAFDPLRTELATYYRELPGLLAAGHAGRAVLIKDRAVIAVYDHRDGATAAGYDRFGVGVAFLAQPIDPRDVDRLAPSFPPLREAAG